MRDGLDLLFVLGETVLVVGADGVIERVLGGPPEALPGGPETLVGRGLGEAFQGEAAEALDAALARAKTGGPQTIEYPLGARYFEARVAPTIEGGAYVLVRDTSARRTAEMRLMESEARFRTMADSAPVMIWMAGTDSRCGFFNSRWLEFSGRALEEELGEGWAEGVHPEDFQQCIQVYMDAFVARRAFRMEYRLRRADGAYRWILDQGTPRFEVSGAFAGYIGSCVDVTEMREANDALTRLAGDLERRVDERTEELESFTYSVSHDLRAPLRAIHGFGGALLDDAGESLDGRSREHLDRIRAASERMSEMIDGLLRLSRIGRTEIRREPVDLGALSERVVARLREAEPMRDVDFSVEGGLLAEADRGLVEIALENLLGNAWKFTSARPRARIEVGGSSLPDGKRSFYVRDDGAGFDMAYASHLFQAFQRLHGQMEFPGHGIGLATVHRVVQRHGGRIWAEGKVGGGATFHFTL
jgi:PAS domain S-box-containing protein